MERLEDDLLIGGDGRREGVGRVLIAMVAERRARSCRVGVARFAVAGALQLGLNPNVMQPITATLVIGVIGARSHGRAAQHHRHRPARTPRRATRFYEEDRVASFM